MSAEDDLKKLLMLPGIAHALQITAQERQAHAKRQQFGDPAKRGECCGPLPHDYPRGKEVAQIPELAERLELVSITNTGYTKWFGCHICGQEWREDAESVGHGELAHVKKAITSSSSGG